MSDNKVSEVELIENGVSIDTEKVKKPTKVFLVKSELADDGVFTTMFYEFCQIGRKKQQKVLYRSVDEYISRIKDLLPYCGDQLEEYLKHLANDNQVIDSEGAKRIGEMNITVWSDAYIQKQFIEVCQSDRGAPTKSVVELFDFKQAMEAQVGSGAESALKLLS
jgi:hypothetical protein